VSLAGAESEGCSLDLTDDERLTLRRSAHRGVTELETDIRKWASEWDKNPEPFVWTETADEIPETLAACCRRVSSRERQAGRRRSPAGTRVPAAARRP
jgi:hypothetical protein